MANEASEKDPWEGFSGESAEEHTYAEGWADGHADGRERRIRQFYMIQELREQLATAEAVLPALIREKQFTAWNEGYRHAYVVGSQEGYSGVVVEYVAPNPYRDE